MESAPVVPLSGKTGFLQKGEPQVSWFSRLPHWLKGLFGQGNADDDDPATEEFATLSSFTLLPGQLKLRVGVVSVRGNYREHNEDNFYVPGRRSVRHDSGSESNSEMPALTLEPSNLFIVADGMGGQQAGEQASLMAVELIPRAIARRLPPDENEPSRIKDAIRDAVAEVNQEILGSSGAITEYSNMGRPWCWPSSGSIGSTWRASATRVPIGCATAGSNSSPRTTRWPTPCSMPARSPPKSCRPTSSRTCLYLYLGSKDARGGPEDVRVLDVRPGDRLLMASDGLTGVVPDKDLARILGTVDDPRRPLVSSRTWPSPTIPRTT